MDFRGFDSNKILSLRGGIPRPIGNFLESSSQQILAGIILVRGTGRMKSSCSLSLAISSRRGCRRLTSNSRSSSCKENYFVFNCLQFRCFLNRSHLYYDYHVYYHHYHYHYYYYCYYWFNCFLLRGERRASRAAEPAEPTRCRAAEQLRPISLLRISLLRLLDSNFPGNSPWT